MRLTETRQVCSTECHEERLHTAAKMSMAPESPLRRKIEISFPFLPSSILCPFKRPFLETDAIDPSSKVNGKSLR